MLESNFSQLCCFFLPINKELSVHWTSACPGWRTSVQWTSKRQCGGCVRRGLSAFRLGTSTTSATQQSSSMRSVMVNWALCNGLTRTSIPTASERRVVGKGRHANGKANLTRSWRNWRGRGMALHFGRACGIFCHKRKKDKGWRCCYCS